MTEFTKLTPSYQGGEFAKPEHVIEVQEAFAPIESELADHEARVTAQEAQGTVLVASGVTDASTAINALLSAAIPSGMSRRVVTLVGDFTISNTLVVHSDTLLDLSRATLTLNSGSNKRMIENVAIDGVSPRDHDIEIIFGHVDRGGNGGSGNNLHSIAMRRVDRLKLSGGTYASTSGKYMFQLLDLTVFDVGHFHFLDVSSDGVHLDGPSHTGTIHDISGKAGDDLVAVTPVDWAQYQYASLIGGTVENVTIERITGNDTELAIVKVLEGQGVKTRNITVRTIRGNSTGTSAIKVGADGTESATTGGELDNILLDDIACTSDIAGQSPILFTPSNAKKITVKNFMHPSKAAEQAGIQIMGPIETLAIDTMGMYNAGALSQAPILFYTSGVVDTLQVSNAKLSFDAAGTFIKYNDGVSGIGVKRILVQNSEINWPTTSGQMVGMNNAGHLCDILELSNVVLNGAAWILDTNHTMKVFLSNVSKPTGNAFYIRASGDVTIRARNCDIPGSISGLSGRVQRVREGFACDVSILTPANGDQAYNTNAALGCGVGPVVSNGTLWKNLYTGSTT